MYDIIIIGAGPAGMTSAIYATRARKKILVIEALNYGGQIVNTLDIENYPTEEHISGFDFATKLYNQAKKLGAEFIFEKVFQIINHEEYKEVRTNNDSYQTKTVIIATGSKNRKLGIENDWIGKGVSYCATCDGNFYKEKDVAVVGGGNTALEDALYLSNIANKVYLIHRRNEFRASLSTVLKVKEKENIEIIYNSEITKLNGTETVEEIEILVKNKSNKKIKVSGVFIAIGQIPATDAFTNLVNLDDDGYIVANEDCHTNIEGIFVAGDNRKKSLRQLVTATSDGAIAADEAIKYLNTK